MVPILSMFFRAKKLILLSFIIIFALVLLVLALKPEKYVSHMSFLLRNERAEPLVGSDPHQNTVQLPSVTEIDLNSEVELLNSSEVLRQVVINCNLANNIGDHDAAVESAVRKLSKSLTITAVRNSSLINVTYTTTKRSEAKEVLVQLAKVYLAKRLNLHTSNQADLFFDDQTQKTQTDLQSAEQERAGFLAGNGYEDISQQMQQTLQYIQELRSQLDGVQTLLGETQGRLREVAADRDRTPQRIPTQQRNSTNQAAVEQLTSSLVALQNRRTELLTKVKSDDRVVAQMNQEIQTTQDALSRIETMRPQESVSDANPAWQSLDTEQNRLDQTRMGLLDRKAGLQAQLAREEARLRRMESDSVHVNDLERNVKNLGDKYDLYQNKAVAAKMADQLDAQHISNVVLSTEPVLPAIPEPSQLNLFTGFLLALFASLSIGFLSQLVSKKLHGVEAVESECGIPVMATL